MKKSTIKPYDHGKLLPSTFGYFQQIEGWLSDHAEIPEDAHDICRKLFEAVYHVKYFPHLREKIDAGASITEYVRTLVEKGIYTEDEAESFLEFFPQIHSPHHHQYKESTSEESSGDIKFTFRRTLELIKSV